MSKKIKWAALQPLTGGMYLGAEEAIGSPAEFILSYPGVNAWKINKKGETVGCGNEVNLTEYLKEKGRMVPYYVFNRAMFQNDYDFDSIEIHRDTLEGEVETPSYEGLDIVVGVPVCSGLSTATSGASQEALDARNCNMKFLAKYCLEVIKPTIYIFENAPTLFSGKGEKVRQDLDAIAEEAGYSVLYYKTDTNLHNNCQRRKRTFVIFQKKTVEGDQTPILYEFVKNIVPADEYLKGIPANATQQDLKCNFEVLNECLLRYVQKLGPDWRTIVRRTPIIWLRNEGKTEEFIEFINAQTDIDEEGREKAIKNVRRMNAKMDEDKGYFFEELCWNLENKIGSVMFRMMPCHLHPTEDRILNVREFMHLMGMPDDMDFKGAIPGQVATIGQNVPEKTAKFIVEQAVRIINGWDELQSTRLTDDGNIAAQDNIKAAGKY